jgi:hypothetical protein
MARHYEQPDMDAVYQWAAESDEWRQYAGNVDGVSYEAAWEAYEVGAPTPDHWASVEIHADGADGWGVTLTDDEGNTYTIDYYDAYDLAWDYYDYAMYHGLEYDKDIDTGGTE